MVQAAESGQGYNFAIGVSIRRRQPTRRSRLLQREMRPVLMVVVDILAHQPFQMPLVQHDDVIEQVSPAVSNPAFRYTVLPRTPEAGSLRGDAKALDRLDDFRVEVRGSVEDQMFRC